MANQKDQKRKLLAIQKILFEKTDYSHPLTLNQIMEELAALDIDAERKSIYACIDALREAGMDIQLKNKPKAAYYFANRQFTLEEMTILADVVQSCPALNRAMSVRLEERIGKLASEAQRKALKVHIEVPERPKLRSKWLYVNISQIKRAIRDKKQLAFRYISHDISGKQVFRKKGKKHIKLSLVSEGKPIAGPKELNAFTLCTPVRLVFMAGYYYLVAWDEQAKGKKGKGDFRVFRIDRMARVYVADNKPAVRNERISNYRPEEWEDPAFGMFYNQKGKQTITLLVHDESVHERETSWIMTTFYDKFSESISVQKVDDTTARVRVKTVASPQFFSWLLQFRGQVKIEMPSKLATQYVEEYLKPALNAYVLK